jgi:hypothetical protein
MFLEFRTVRRNFIDHPCSIQFMSAPNADQEALQSFSESAWMQFHSTYFVSLVLHATIVVIGVGGSERANKSE